MFGCKRKIDVQMKETVFITIHSQSLTKAGFRLAYKGGSHKAFRGGIHKALSFTVRFKGDKKLTTPLLHQNFSRVSGCKTILNPLRNQIRAQSRTEDLRICIL